MRGKIVSLVFSAQAGANWSPASGTLTVNVYSGTGTPVKRAAGGAYTGETTILTIATNLTAGGAVTSISGSSSIVMPVAATQAEVQFTWTPVGTAGAADDITIDDLQLESNNSPSTWTVTNYDRVPFISMLEACKRYYQKTFTYGIAPAVGAGSQNALTAVAVAT